MLRYCAPMTKRCREHVGHLRAHFQFGLVHTHNTCWPHNWVSRVRAACLESSPKALKAGLAARGIKCDGCNMREQYLDRLLDSVHLPVITNK